MKAAAASTEQIALLQRSLEHITRHLQLWDERVWAERADCGTAYRVDLAGAVVVLAGHEMDREPAGPGELTELASYTTDGRRIDRLAAELLGLDEHQAPSLFSVGNSLSDLWRLAVAYSGGRVARPAKFDLCTGCPACAGVAAPLDAERAL